MMYTATFDPRTTLNVALPMVSVLALCELDVESSITSTSTPRRGVSASLDSTVTLSCVESVREIAQVVENRIAARTTMKRIIGGDD
jgi:hypothetical protein